MELVLGFRAIQGTIMICGSSTVGPSSKKGMFYTSDGNNYIWDALDETLRIAFNGKLDEGERTFKEIINDYKKIVFSDSDYNKIRQLLNEGKFLCDADNVSGYALEKARSLQLELIKKLNKYGFGFTDAISSCYMEGTADASRTGDPVYNNSLQKDIDGAKLFIINGLTKTRKGSIGSFRSAMNIYGKCNDQTYEELKKHSNIVELPSTSGSCPLPKDDVVRQWSTLIAKMIKKETNIYRY